MIFSIDINCDMGEGMPGDDLIMPYISSANIACGAHAGNMETMEKTINLALKHNVAIGAHPGFADKADFGRKEQALSPEVYYQLVTEQLYTLQKIIDASGAALHHVKPHGALYNISAKNAAIATIIAKAVKDHNPGLILYGLSNSQSIAAAENMGLQTASEVFADRTYTAEGLLTPRSLPNALIHSGAQCVQQVLQMLQQQSVTAVNNKTVPIKAETICIHGDGPYALQFAQIITAALQKNNIEIKAL